MKIKLVSKGTFVGTRYSSNVFYCSLQETPLKGHTLNLTFYTFKTKKVCSLLVK